MGDLILQLNADGNKDKWKIVTIFIGANDVCDYCEHPVCAVLLSI
jgi:hypothetical protein